MTLPPKEAPPSPLIIDLHTKPLLHSSFYQSLIFQLLITFYYCLLVFTGTHTANKRVMLYCFIFIINEAIKNIDSLIENIDPLGIQPIKKILQWLGWLVKANMLYLLCALAYLQQPLPVIIMTSHFLVSNYKKNKPDASNFNQKGKSYHKIMDFINPILLYSFLKEFDNEQSDLSIIFLIFLCVNLISASQIRLILANQESDFAGWSFRNKDNGKVELTWDKKYALKLIIIACSVCLVLQNLLLIFDSIKNEVCLNILHTLIIGATVYLKSHNGLPFFR